MLQQTQVNTVIDYFNRFMLRFPDISKLANATEDEVLHYWTGLGYYTRARNLHRTAKIIHTEFNDQFPEDCTALEKLPGIGRSTAGAIAAIAFNQPVAILDGNVKRVLTRLQGITTWPGERKTLDLLWTLAENYTPTHRAADYTQAIMDMGATICIRGTPHCPVCPLEKICIARSKKIEKKLPVSAPRKTLPIRQTTWLIFQKNNFIFLKKSPPKGVWASLWRFPDIDGMATPADIKKFCLEQFQISIQKIKRGDLFRHTFSHFHLDILPVFISIKTQMAENETQRWYDMQEKHKVGLPAPVKVVLENL